MQLLSFGRVRTSARESMLHTFLSECLGRAVFRTLQCIPTILLDILEGLIVPVKFREFRRFRAVFKDGGAG